MTISTGSFHGGTPSRGPKLISIARSKPRGFGSVHEFKRLAPPYTLLMDYKAGQCTWDEYETRFKRDVLDKLDRDLTLKELELKFGNDIHLLCWEPVDKYCHRRLVYEWLTG